MRYGVMLAAVGLFGCGESPAPAGDDGTSGGATTVLDSGSFTGSSGEGVTSTGPGIPPEVDWPHLSCDPLVDTMCGLPFPNNVFTVADETTATGRRVAFDDAIAPMNVDGVQTQTFPFDRSDGFSTSAALLAHLPGATVTGLPSPDDIGRYADADCPTVIMNAEAGGLAPHFAELDNNAPAGQRMLFIRPVVPLWPAERYIVAIRNVVDGTGEPVPAPAPFAALRDGTPTDDPDIEGRRGLYEDIFARLAEAGIERDELQLAWDFTTASDENNTGWLLAMRDAALEVVGGDGPAYVIEEATADPTPEVMLLIEGTMTVPLFLDDPDPGGALVFGDDGLPQQAGEADYGFTVVVPPSAATEPAGIISIGPRAAGEPVAGHGWVLPGVRGGA